MASPSTAHLSDQEFDLIPVECCRACAYRYEFKLLNNEIVTVLCGRPQDVLYKAVSYLWEDYISLPLRCRNCSSIKRIPMRDSRKLWKLLSFARGGSKIWLDSMSIDQDDPKDLSAQLMVMGDIYRKAETVSVFLPFSDEGAYERLKELAITSDAVVKCHNTPTNSEYKEQLARLAGKYLELFSQWTEDVEKWKYWSRAWTFQEWTMATDIEITWEGAKNNEGVKNIKNLIVMASSIIGRQQMVIPKDIGKGSDYLRKRMEMREETGRFLNLVRAHFPFHDFSVSDGGEDPSPLRDLTFSSPLRALGNGTFVTLQTHSDKSPTLQSILSLVLNAISLSKREATKKADLVACWASMCNISYPYNKDDTFAVALHKVVTALRRRGLPIYNFLANTYGGETDLMFMDYATAHRHSNSRREGYLFGSPIFTGRADTITHIRHLLNQNGDLTPLEPHINVMLQRIDKTVIKQVVSLADKPKVLSVFRSSVSGSVDGERVTDVVISLEKCLDETPVPQLEKCILIQASIFVEDVGIMPYFNTWAICPSSIKVPDLEIARESLNGTLVLATCQGLRPAKEMQIVSYLNMTHQSHGTYLVKSDGKGIVDMVFRTADTPQQEVFGLREPVLSEELLSYLQIMESVDDQVFNMRIYFQSNAYTVRLGIFTFAIGLGKMTFTAASENTGPRFNEGFILGQEANL
jgi:hypothetical protein